MYVPEIVEFLIQKHLPEELGPRLFKYTFGDLVNRRVRRRRYDNLMAIL